MSVQSDIKTFLTSIPEPKQAEMRALHKLIQQVAPKCKLWFSDGRDEKGKVVANPTIGYGQFTITYAGGKTKEWFRIGLSANATGISVYVLGLTDKNYLRTAFGKSLGKASVTGYCIRFKSLADIDPDVLAKAVGDGFRGAT